MGAQQVADMKPQLFRQLIRRINTLAEHNDGFDHVSAFGVGFPHNG